MKTINDILNNYEEYEMDKLIDQRFSKRFVDFLTNEQIDKNIEKVCYRFKEECERKIKPWTEEEVLKQLHQDVNFGWEKCCDERGISAELMANVVLAWNKILENGLDDIEYSSYGRAIFMKTARHYGWELEDWD